MKFKLYKIYLKEEISASHKLNLPYESKCRNLHGHNYMVEVWIDTEELNELGMVVDFSAVKKVIKEFDHRHLNDSVILNNPNPTAERLAEVIAERIAEVMGNKYLSIVVRVWEDRDSFAEVYLTEAEELEKVE